MNAAARKHLPELSFGAKMRKLYSLAFWLPANAMYHMQESVAAGGWSERDCINLIDEVGSWID